MSIEPRTPEKTFPLNQFPFWSVKAGKLSDNEWGVNIEFAHINDFQWNVILKLVKTYSTIRFENCPAAYISETSRRIQFRFGPSASKPILVVDSTRINPSECESCLNQLIECAEIFHKHGLGFWLLDRQLLWKIDGKFLFIPAFWLPAFGVINAPYVGLPPEYVGRSLLLPSQPGDIYAIASFCFRTLTGNEYDHGKPELPGDIRPDLKENWDSILDSALRKTPTRRPTSFEMWKNPGETKPEPSHKSDRRTVLKVLAALMLLLVGWYILVPGLFQRGTGSYVVRYANRSYDRAKWERVWSSENNIQLCDIGGWDAKNAAVGGTFGVVLRDGHWQVQNAGFSKPYFTNARTFYAFNSERPTRLWRYALSGDEPQGSDFDRCSAGYNFCQLDRNYFQFWGRQSVYGKTFLHEIVNNTFSDISEDENKIRIWQDAKTYKEDVDATGLELYHSFGNGKALAFHPENKSMVLYKNGRWYEHHKTTHDNGYGVRNAIWAMDKDNFILVSNRGDRGTITQFRRGKEYQRDTSGSNWQFSGFLAVWGVGINKFWVLDNLGNVAQFDNDNVRRLISGPKLTAGDFFCDAWVSPEGVVYAITEKEVYRLD